MNKPSEELRKGPYFYVRYYDAQKSRRGQGVQVRSFAIDQRAEADKFAAENRLYGRACQVDNVPPDAEYQQALKEYEAARFECSERETCSHRYFFIPRDGKCMSATCQGEVVKRGHQ